MPDTSGAPPVATGIPDPQNPGYDTGGFPMPGAGAPPPPPQTSFVNTSAKPFTGPTGIPDPKNPGYDTAGFVLGATYDPATGKLVIPNSGTGNTSRSTVNQVGNITSPQTTTAPGGVTFSKTPPGATDPNALAPFSEKFTPPPGTGTLPATPWGTFTPPTVADALNDPGYAFTKQQGESALQNWAAAKGTLNDSETADALIGYGQGLAATQYGNVYNRAAQTYNTNLGPQLVQWNAQIGQNNTNYSNAWTQFLQDYTQYLNRFNTIYNNSTAA